MAGFTGCREIGGDVIWVCGCGVIILMASETILRGCGIISVMAGRTVIGYRHMCTSQHVIIVMYCEGGRLPSRLRGVTCFTCCGNTDGRVIRVYGFIKIRRMTAVAYGGGSDVAIRMAFDAFSGLMSPG